MSSPSRAIHQFIHRLTTFLLILTTGASLLAAAPVVASASTTDEATDDACDPVAIAEDEWEDYGLIGRREYESPQFGIGADWDRPWAVDDEANYPIVSNEDCQYDDLRLAWEDGDLFGWLTLEFAPPADIDSMDDLVDRWSSRRFLSTNWGKDYTAYIVVTDADETTADAVFSLVRNKDDVQYYVIFRTVALGDDAWLYLTLTTDDASLEDAMAALDDGVRVDDEPIPAVLTWRTIERSL